MIDFSRAPWSIRGYALLLFGIGLAVVIAGGGHESSWVSLMWGVVGVILLFRGSRFMWWLMVAGNAALLVAAPFLSGLWWLEMPLSIAGLALLLAPDSRQFIFEQRAPTAPDSTL